MSVRELKRIEVLARVKAGALKVKDAAVLLGVCERHAKRLLCLYRRKGPAALRHQSVGRRSNRAKRTTWRRKVVKLYRRKYAGDVKRGEAPFGPTLASEHLHEEDGLEVHPETLRRWLLAEGLWARKRKGVRHRQRRERKAHFGELVQIDGSFHDWLERRGPRGCRSRRSTTPRARSRADSPSRRRSGPRWRCCGGGSSDTGFRTPSTPTGRTCTCGSRPRRREPREA